MKRGTALLLGAMLALASPARAEDEDPSALFQGATKALAEGRAGEAIVRLEALADRGVQDPVASFDRGLAYAMRGRTSAAQPGDLGRAVHGFEEARDLTRDGRLEADAKRALVALRQEIARRRARAGESAELAVGASLGRALVELAAEETWAGLAAVAAVVLSVAIALRARAEAARAKVAANTTMAISALVLGATALLADAARDARLHLREAVVVAPGTRLLDARRVVVPGRDPLAEGARVRLVSEDAGFAHVQAGALDGWVSSNALLPLAKRR